MLMWPYNLPHLSSSRDITPHNLGGSQSSFGAFSSDQTLPLSVRAVAENEENMTVFRTK